MTEGIFAVLYVSIMGLTRCYKTTVFYIYIQHNVAWAEAHLCTKSYRDPSSPLATIYMGRKVGGGCCGPVREENWVSPCDIMSPGPRATSLPSGMLIHPTVWPQHTNVTDRQDRQPCDNIGRTGLQTVAQKRTKTGFEKVCNDWLNDLESHSRSSEMSLVDRPPLKAAELTSQAVTYLLCCYRDWEWSGL